MNFHIIDTHTPAVKALELSIREKGHGAEVTPLDSLLLAEGKGDDAILLPIENGAEAGLQILNRVAMRRLELVVVAVPETASQASALELVRQGAVDILQQPFTLQELDLVLARLQRIHQWRERIDTLAQLPGAANGDHPTVGEMISLHQIEEAHLRKVIERAESLAQAARVLGIDQATLYRKRKRIGLE